MALVEHELYHAAQETDASGAPKFSRSTGRPVFVIRGQDVEEFVGVVVATGQMPQASVQSSTLQTGHQRSPKRRSHMRAAPANLGSPSPDHSPSRTRCR
ncbi:putative metallopeptidase [Sinorhizobium terangae]|nr:putative metallopeptidase [Sinorhizobium terangae]WFU46213.1 putative metallopeptidase [Sinorhizobium terangae]